MKKCLVIALSQFQFVSISSQQVVNFCQHINGKLMKKKECTELENSSN